MDQLYTILLLNPGSTSTKLAISHADQIGVSETIYHRTEELKQFKRIWDQFPFRLEACKKWASEHVDDCSAVVTLGGLFRPVSGGVYPVNKRMLEDARANLQGEHASNCGCALADELARDYHVPAFVVDPVSVDEFEALAHYSGHPMIRRSSLSHALSLHGSARRAAAELGMLLDVSSFIIAHIGGGISVAPVRGGEIIDVNDAASDGPFSPERSGGLPLQPLISLCFSGKYAESELRSMVMGEGGLVAYLGTNSVREVECRIRRGDGTAREVLEAMAYQIAKEIGAMSTVLNGRVDAIVLTGGAVQSSFLTSWIDERVRFIAPVIVHTGELEMQSLAQSALRVLRDEEQAKEY